MLVVYVKIKTYEERIRYFKDNLSYYVDEFDSYKKGEQNDRKIEIIEHLIERAQKENKK